MLHADGQRQQVKLCPWSPFMFSESSTLVLRQINYQRYDLISNNISDLIKKEPILLIYLSTLDEIIFVEESQVV